MIELSSRMAGSEVTDGVTDEINLRWAVPQDDGGYSITGIYTKVANVVWYSNTLLTRVSKIS